MSNAAEISEPFAHTEPANRDPSFERRRGQSERFDSAAVERAVRSAVEERLTPGAVLSIYQYGVPVFRLASGQLSSGSDHQHSVKLHTVYDVGSLTVPMVTIPMLIRLAGLGRFKVGDRISRHLQNFGVNGKSKITISQLLSHSAGFVDYYPFFEELKRENSGSRLGILTSRGAREYVINAIQRGETHHQAGTKTIPSQLSYMLAGALVEALSAQPLERAIIQLLTSPLGLKSTGFIDVELLKRRQVGILMEMVAPTGKCSWRGREMWGEVADENCWAMGGIAGHAGIFSSADDLQLIAIELLRALKGGSDYFQAEPTKELLLRGDKNFEDEMHHGFVPAGSKFFDLAPTGFTGALLGASSDTGCSVVLDPAKQLSIILLANPKHMGQNLRKFADWRRSLHDSIFKALI